MISEIIIGHSVTIQKTINWLIDNSLFYAMPTPLNIDAFVLFVMRRRTIEILFLNNLSNSQCSTTNDINNINNDETIMLVQSVLWTKFAWLINCDSIDFGASVLFRCSRTRDVQITVRNKCKISDSSQQTKCAIDGSRNNAPDLVYPRNDRR